MVKISILVAVYNSQNFLRECLDSLINQSLKEIEIICINDGSIDNSENILLEYSKKDSRIQIYRQGNRGASSARNLGLNYCSGKYICMVDSDDFLELGCLEKTYLYAEKNNLDASIFQMIFYSNNYKKKFENLYKKEILKGKEAMILSLDWKIPGVGLYKNRIIKKIKYDESNINGDELSTRKFLLESSKVGFSSGEYFYRNNLESITRKFSLKQFDILDSRELIKKFLIENKIYSEIKKEFEYQNYKILLGRLIYFHENKIKLNNKEKEEIYIKIKKFYKTLDLEVIGDYLKNKKNREQKIYVLSMFKWSFKILSKTIQLHSYLKNKI
ncbi:MAG: glycosyltransferase family 2 protein [Cetobacterium sp.]